MTTGTGGHGGILVEASYGRTPALAWLPRSISTLGSHRDQGLVGHGQRARRLATLITIRVVSVIRAVAPRRRLND